MKDSPAQRERGGGDGCPIPPSAGAAGVRAPAGPAGLDSNRSYRPSQQLFAGIKPEPFPTASVEWREAKKTSSHVKGAAAAAAPRRNKPEIGVCAGPGSFICVAVSPPAEPGAGWGRPRPRPRLQVVQTRVITGI